MSRKRAAALALAGLVLAVLVGAAMVGTGGGDEPPGGPRGAEGGAASGSEAGTDQRQAEATSASGSEAGTDQRQAEGGPASGGEAGTSEREAAGGTAAGRRTELEPLEEPHWNVYVVRARRGPPRRLTDMESEVPENPDWSPDGARIVFSGMDCEDCDAGLRVVNADGSRSRRLRSAVANVADPSWSPDGRTLAVTRVGGVIFSVDSATGEAQRLTSDREASEGPDWSPRTHKIAYARQVSAANWDIYSMNADGRGKRPITRGPRQELAPAWSPSGRKIAFQRQERSGVWAIYTANADGSHPTRVTHGRSSEQPTWSPDGRRIAFVRVTVAGSRIVVVSLKGERHRQAFVTPPSLQAAYPDWSPDGGTVAFTAKHLHHE
jgi:Tol biopolymer transport system component